VHSNDGVWGTGFFVAPGWVLTDAHVLWPRMPLPRQGSGREDAADRAYRAAALRRTAGGIGLLLPDGQVLCGRWAAAFPGCAVVPDHPDGLTPWPDLALIRVENAPDHPCVLLDERRPLRDARVAISGYAVRYDGFFKPFSDNGDVTGFSEVSPLRRRMHLDNYEVPHGASGGPVVDLNRGMVCGVITAQRARLMPGGAASPIAGLRELVRALGPMGAGLPDAERFELADDLRLTPEELLQELWRGHDRHHARGPRAGVRRGAGGTGAPEPAVSVWVQRAARLSEGAPGLDLVRTARLRARLAELPTPRPAAVFDLVERLAPNIPIPDTPMHLWRDGLNGVITHATADVVRTAELFCAQAADWHRRVEAWSGRLVLSVERAFYSRRGVDEYVWRLQRLQGDAVMICGQEDRPVPAHALRDALRGPLAAALQLSDRGGAVLIEAVLPRELFERLELEAMPIARGPDGAELTLGAVHPVVIRDGDRDEAARPAHDRIWRALHEGPIRPVPVVGADGESVPVTADEEVPIWSGSVTAGGTAGMLARSLDAGRCVMVWSRASGPGGRTVLAAPTFGECLSEAVTADELPGLVRDLRARPNRPESPWAGSLVLLYDRPEDPVAADEPLTPLA
jgi:hypothetical protein